MHGLSIRPATPAGVAGSVGLVAAQMDRVAAVGEIGLNAVDAAVAGRGIGTALYGFALGQMRRAGMAVAVVGTGVDTNHAAARRAYRETGLDREVPSVGMCRALDP